MSLGDIHFDFLRHGPLLVMTSPSRMVCLANEPQGSSCFYLPRARIVSAHHHAWLFVWPGVKLESTHLHVKCFICLMPFTFIFTLKNLFYFKLWVCMRICVCAREHTCTSMHMHGCGYSQRSGEPVGYPGVMGDCELHAWALRTDLWCCEAANVLKHSVPHQPYSRLLFLFASFFEEAPISRYYK